MDLDIAGGPELIESMDGSAGNYPGSNPHFGLEHFETHGWQRSKYGWIAPKEWGLRSHKDNRASGGLGAAPVEGGFGDDFVRRNRSQLRHAFECWW